MTIDSEFLSLLVCPETQLPLAVATQSQVDQVNSKIEEGTLTNRAGQKIVQKIEGGLVPVTRPSVMYPVRQGIPILLLDEAISFSTLS